MNDTSTDGFPSLNKNAAAHYDQFFGPLYFEPYAIEVAKRIAAYPASIVLELASGTGRVTRHIREHITPSARLIASDIDEDMLTVAEQQLNHLNIDWQKINAEQLPFAEQSIDMIVCCFGYMFVPNKQQAFAEAFRVLKPGGLLIFTTWDQLEHNGASYTARCMAEQYLGEPLPGSYDLATSMSDERAITASLKNAGFGKVVIEKVSLSAVCATAGEAAHGFVQGAVFEEFRKRYPDRVEEAQLSLSRELAQKFGASPMIAPMRALISQAWK
ncbi:class I SAM-dependent methyltransferase [Niabella sp. 22666]|uniref:class I SAM-dependent methyltransferase n=1 Tax=Niabella sp. 22666 TaxID=3453954 RepID=UPI003F8629FA